MPTSDDTETSSAGGADQRQLMSTALVIGIGGTGVQTLSRLRRALRDPNNPAITLVDNVHLLAFDAVDQGKQMPPLPPDSDLEDDEFFDIIGGHVVNAHQYVKSALAHDPVLAASWDPDYIAPNEPLTDGLKRARPLGDLAFEINRHRVESRIRSLFSRALASGSAKMVYEDSVKARLPVIIVASGCGGTGSSGFLHVLHAVHRVAKQRSVTLQVYPVIYLPDVFADAIETGDQPTAIRQAHRSNAYALLSELDMMLTHPTLFDDTFARNATERLLDQHMSPQDIVATSFLVDGKLSDGNGLAGKAAYQLTANALFSLLLTDDNNRMGIEGTNATAPGLDAHVPPQRRAFGTIGGFAITFPESTMRRYVSARTQAELISKWLIDPDANKSEYGATISDRLVDRLTGLTTEFSSEFRSLLGFRDLADKVAAIPVDFEELPDVSGLDTEHATLVSLAREAARQMDARRTALEHSAITRIEDSIDTVLQDSGEGTQTLIYALKLATSKVRQELQEAEDSKTAANRAKESVSGPNGSLTQARAEVEEAFSAFIAVRGRRKQQAISEYHAQAGNYMNQILEAQVYAARCTVLEKARLRLEESYQWMRSAQKVLQEELDELQDTWRRDDLVGKDSGEPGQTLLVPSDMLPQIEDSALARSVWKSITRAMSEDPALHRPDSQSAPSGYEWLRGFVSDMGQGHVPRGLLSLGMGDHDPNQQQATLDRIRRQLEVASKAWADPAEVLPQSLEMAAQRVDGIQSGDEWASAAPGEETRRLEMAVENLESYVKPPLSFQPGKMQLQPGDTTYPPRIVITATGPMLQRLKTAMVGPRFYDSRDPQRVTSVITLSGLTIGSVSGVEDWYQAYSDILLNRRKLRTRANQPPPNLKRSLTDAVRRQPLVRKPYSTADVADLVVRAAVVSRLPGAPVEFKQERIKNTYQIMVYGRRVSVVNSRLEPQTPAKLLGHDLTDWFDAIGRDPLLHRAIEEVFEFVSDQAFKAFEQGDTDPLDHLIADAQAFKDFNSQEWRRLKDLENPDDKTLAATLMRAALVTAGSKLIDETLRIREHQDVPWG